MSNDRFVSPYPPPTEHEREVLTLLIEECAEVQQRATKMLRFGVEEVQPGQPYSNSARLGMEIGDLLEVGDMVARLGLVSGGSIAAGRQAKARQLAKYMQTSPDDAQ